MPMTRKYFIQHIHGMLEEKTGPEVAGNSQFYILKQFFSIANILRRFCLRLRCLHRVIGYGVARASVMF